MASTGASHGDFLLFSFLCLNISFSNNYCPYLWFCIYGPVGERSRGGGGERERERGVSVLYFTAIAVAFFIFASRSFSVLRTLFGDSLILKVRVLSSGSVISARQSATFFFCISSSFLMDHALNISEEGD